MSRQIMTPERIAEINRIACNLDRENPAYGALNEALDALESAQAEIAVDAGRLRDAAMRVWGEDAHGCDTPDRLADAILGLRAQIADLKRGGVVVPDEDVEFCAKVILDEWDCGNLVSRGAWTHGDAFDELRKALSASRLRTIPADRELMRLVDELIRWHGLRPLDKRPDHAAALVGAIKALRAQPTQELAP